MKVLAIDIGGTHVKVLAAGQDAHREFDSGPTLTPRRMVSEVRKVVRDWKYDVVSIGYPGPVLQNRPVSEPWNLGKGWCGFNFERAFNRPVKVLNDAAMQALGSYKRGRMLFLGLGTGLGSALIVDGIIEPMELGHLPYKKATFEDYVGIRGLEKYGKKKWRRYVTDVVERLVAAIEPDEVVLGGGNVRKLKALPAGCRIGDNANAFVGGFRVWEEAGARKNVARGRPRLHKRERTQVSRRKETKRERKRPSTHPRETEGDAIKTLGFDKPLYILPFDHRGSFVTKMFGWHGDLTPEQTAEIATAKQVIYDGFKAAVAAGVSRDEAGILVDEQFGAAILRDAAAKGFVTACPAEKSGQDEFDFEFGTDFEKHIELFHPTFCKVLVRYNPEGDAALNQRQSARLKQLCEYLRDKSRSRFMFELLVPAEKAQLDRLKGNTRAYDLDLRPKLMVQAIKELQDAGVEPDVWKIEGLDRRQDCQEIVSAAHRAGRDKVGCIILGRGEDDKKVRDWLTTAAGVKGFIGFAVGRTDFWEPLINFLAKKTTREAAVAEIARRYREFVGIFEKARNS